MAFVASIPNKITTDEVEFGASVSEEQATKVAGSINYILDRFKKYYFGAWGAEYDNLSVYPYVFSETIEIVDHNYILESIDVILENSGSSGTSQFLIERQLVGSGSWSTVYDLEINSGSGSNLFFKNTDTVSGITQSTSITNFLAEEKLRFTILSASSGAKNIKLTMNLRPTE